jgi:hypothetical protein
MGGIKLPLMPWKECNIQPREVEIMDEEFVDLVGVQSEKKKQLHQQRYPTFSCQIPSLHMTEAEKEVKPKIRTPSSILRSRRRSNQGRCSSTSDTTKYKAPRKVFFNEVAQVMWIESIEDMSLEELDASYYTPQEYFDIREREKSLFRQLSNWGTIGSTEDDVLGLECRVQRYHRKGRSRDSIYSVVLEQEMNRNPQTGVCDDFALSQIYLPYTLEATRMARDRALKNSAQVETASCQQDRTDRYFSICATTNFMADQKMETTYQKLKQAVDTTVEPNVYSGVIKYAISCLPPSPVSLRLGHDPRLQMAQPEDEKPWSDEHENAEDKQEEGRAKGEVDYFDIDMKLCPPLPQKLARTILPPQGEQCTLEFYYPPKNPRPTDEVARAQCIARQERFHPRAFEVPALQQPLKRKHHRPAPRTPISEWTWSPVVWDFVPVTPTRMISWNRY